MVNSPSLDMVSADEEGMDGEHCTVYTVHLLTSTGQAGVTLVPQLTESWGG